MQNFKSEKLFFFFLSRRDYFCLIHLTNMFCLLTSPRCSDAPSFICTSKMCYLLNMCLSKQQTHFTVIFWAYFVLSLYRFLDYLVIKTLSHIKCAGESLQPSQSERRVLILDCSGLSLFDYTGASMLLQVFITPDTFCTQKYMITHTSY